MILRFSDDATLAQRAHVERFVRTAGMRAVPSEGGLLLLDSLERDEVVGLACLPGVKSVTPGRRTYSTLRVVALGWTAAACAALGLLTVVAANFPAPLGTPADPMRTVEGLRSSWPLLPVHALVERAPDWLPVSLLPALALALLVMWPLVGGRIARKAPVVHGLIGVTALLAAVCFAVLEFLG